MEFRVGLPTDGLKRWRCDICSLLNVWENDECKRCKEPVDESRKRELHLKPRKIEGTTPRYVNKNTANRNNNNTNNNNNTATTNNKFSNRSKPIFNKRISKSNNKNNNKVQIYEFNKSKKNRNTYGFNKNGNIKKVKPIKKESYKPLRKENLSEKHLGYKSSKKRANTYVRSKLNHDTAAYRAKFAGKENKNSLSHKMTGMKKGVPVYTMNDLTKNGFQTRINHPNKTGKLPIKKHNNINKSKYNYEKKRQKINKKIVSLHDERPVTPPPKKTKNSKGQKKRSLIDMLQKECSGEIMANLRQGGRYIRKEKKNMEGGKSKYDL